MKVAADFRRIARDSLKGKWLVAVLAGMIAALLGVTSWEGAPKFSIHFKADGPQATVEALGQRVYLQDVFQSVDIEAILASASVYILLLSLIGLVFQLIVSGIVNAGYSKFNLDLVDGEKTQLGTLFAYASQWKTMVIANLLMTLYTVLWMLLFIIPGIIAAYRYSMTYYILAENPELSASEAIERSTELMNGNKWRLFCLSFSFIGWNILCTLTFGIGSFWLNPYKQAATAAFYRDITMPATEKKTDIPLLASVDSVQDGDA